MALSNYLILIKRTTKLVGFVLLRCAHRAVQVVVWSFNGTNRKISDSQKPNNYERCVQVLDVVLFYAFDSMVCTSRSNFICRHNRFEDPRYIFDNDHVTLITLDDKYAIFGEARRKGMQLWKMDFSAFMKLAQLEYCDRLLLVPLDHFHRMAEELGDPRSEIVFLFNVGRCGSTFMTQLMENTGQCVSISEPGPLFVVLQKQQEQTADRDNLSRLCRDSIRWICRPCTSYKPLVYFVKVAPSCTPILPIVSDVFPHSKYLFMYRNVRDVAQSFYTVLQELPFMFLMSSLARLSSTLRRKFLTQFGMWQLFEKEGAVWDDMVLGTVGFIKVCEIYLEFRNKGFPISAVRYEDTVSDPLNSTKRIFNYCGLPDSLVERSLEGLVLDSQRNSPLSMARLKKHKRGEYTLESKRFSNQLLTQFNFPLIGEECLLEGTITSSK